jgi:transposase
MTYVGLDVHARSTHAAAIDSLSGELRRARFGPGVEAVVEWLGGLRGPVRAVYEAGPTGFGLARAAQRTGIELVVAAPSKTPRAPGDRVKSDRKDAELLARLLLAGQLKAVWVPPDWLEAIRHLARVREAVRRDLGRARQRASKLLLVEGRVYPEATTWNHATARGSRVSVSSTRRPSSRWSICWPPSMGSLPVAKRSMSGSRGWPRIPGCGRRSRACAPSAESTP